MKREIPIAEVGQMRAFDTSGLVRRLFAIDTRTAALLGALIVIVGCVPLAAALNIWIDEAFTLHTTGAGPLEAWRRAISFEAQPPLYFFIVAAWRSLNETSIAFARLPSVAFAAGTAVVIVFAAHRIAPRVPPLAAALVVALNPLVIWAAVEMRVYALVLFIGAALTWTFYEGFVASYPSRGARFWYVLFAIAGLYTQYYVAFLIAAQGIALLAVRRGSVRVFSIAAVIIAVAFAPFLGVAWMHAHSSGTFVIRVPFTRAIHEIVDAVFTVVLPHTVEWHGPAKVLGFAAAAVLLVTLTVFGRPTVPRGPALAIVVQWLVCLAIFGLLFTVAGVPLEPLKYVIVAAPSSLLVAFLLVSSVQRRPAAAAMVAVAAYGVFAVATLFSQYRPPLMKPGDWQRLAATISAGDRSVPVAVFPAELGQPLSWYLPVATVQIPKPMPFALDYVHQLTLTNESDVARILDPVREHWASLWMVTTTDCSGPEPVLYNYHCRYLETYLKRRYHLVKSVPFRGSLARLYSRIPGATAELPNEAL